MCLTVVLFIGKHGVINRFFNNGIIIAWGSKQITTASPSMEFIYPITFTHLPSVAVCRNTSGTNAAFYDAMITTRSTAKITIYDANYAYTNWFHITLVGW